MLDDKRLAAAQAEAERFLLRISELRACRKPQTQAEKDKHWGRPRYQHTTSACPETAAVKRASMDLTRALAKLRSDV